MKKIYLILWWDPKGATILGQSWPKSICYEGVLHIPQTPKIEPQWKIVPME